LFLKKKLKISDFYIGLEKKKIAVRNKINKLALLAA